MTILFLIFNAIISINNISYYLLITGPKNMTSWGHPQNFYQCRNAKKIKEGMKILLTGLVYLVNDKQINCIYFERDVLFDIFLFFLLTINDIILRNQIN